MIDTACGCVDAETDTGHPRVHVQVDPDTCAWLDEGVVALVQAVTDAGARTVYSCQGGDRFRGRDGGHLPGYLMVAEAPDWFTILGRLLRSSARMSGPERALLDRMASSNVWMAEASAWDPRIGPHRVANTQRCADLPETVELRCRLTLRFPAADADPAAALVRAYALP